MAELGRRGESAGKVRRKKICMLGNEGMAMRQSPCLLNLSGSRVNYYSVVKTRPKSGLRTNISVFSSYAACSPVEIFRYTNLKAHFEPKLMLVNKDLQCKIRSIVMDKEESLLNRSFQRTANFSPNIRKTKVSKSRQKSYIETVNQLLDNLRVCK